MSAADSGVKMLNKDAPHLSARRAREQVQEDLRLSGRDCREGFQDGTAVKFEAQDRLCRIRRATEQAVNGLSEAPPGARPEENGNKKVVETNCRRPKFGQEKRVEESGEHRTVPARGGGRRRPHAANVLPSGRHPRR